MFPDLQIGQSSLGGSLNSAWFFMFQLYGRYPINQREECSRGSVVPHMHRILLGIVRIE